MRQKIILYAHDLFRVRFHTLTHSLFFPFDLIWYTFFSYTWDEKREYVSLIGFIQIKQT